MNKYSEKQLIELSKGVFQCSPNQDLVYANSAGTFYNENQYKNLEKDMKDDCVEIKNPALTSVDTLVEETEEQKAAAKKAEADAKKAEAAAKKAGK
jgi:hypothetical protein